MIKRALARRFAIDCGLVCPRSDEMDAKKTESMSGDMWTPDALDRLVKKNPDGGMFWSLSRRTVRDLRTFHLRPGVVVAIMREKARGAAVRIYLLVKSGEQVEVKRFSPPPEVEELLNASALSILPSDVIEDVERFICAEASRM